MVDEGQAKTLSILRCCSGIISSLASIAIIAMILRSNKKLSTIYHRLVFGLSISDIIHSSAVSLFSLPMPSDNPYAYIALGNKTTCQVQGLFIYQGSIVSPGYNAGLCIFFLLKVRYRVHDTVITRKVEPFLHTVPFFLYLVTATYQILKGNINPAFAVCYVSDYPPGCSNQDDVDCEHGENFRQNWAWYCFVMFHVITPVIIISSMGTIFLTVRNQERRIARYGRGSLQLEEGDNVEMSPYVKKVMYRGLAYSGAWFITFLFPIINNFLYVTKNAAPSFLLRCLIAFFGTFQGFTNFLVFIYPKVMKVKRQQPDTSLLRAFFLALISKDEVSTRAAVPHRRENNSMVVRDIGGVNEGDGAAP